MPSKTNPQDRLTLSRINQMAFAARDGEANHDDARILLTLFCRCIEQGTISAHNPAADRLLEHVRGAFQAYLEDKRGIEAALGLTRKKGRPAARRNEADDDMRVRMATEVLCRRLEGTSHQDALAATAEKFGWSETIVSTAWKDFQLSAIALLQISLGARPFTVPERERLTEIFGNNDWFIASGKSPTFLK